MSSNFVPEIRMLYPFGKSGLYIDTFRMLPCLLKKKNAQSCTDSRNP